MLIWKNFLIASAVFFGWFVVDSVYSLVPGGGLEGVYYPAASGWLKGVPGDWTQKPRFVALMYLCVFGLLWFYLVRNAGLLRGLRIAALMTAFTMIPFWVVAGVTADMYQLELNGWWLRSMIYSNLSFFLYGFLGTGSADDLHF